MQPILERLWLAGERAALRPVDPADAEVAFAALDGRREILDWLVWEGPASRAELADYYADWCRGEDPGTGACDYALAVVDLADGGFAGTLGLRYAAHPGSGDLGYWIAPERQGRGLASEAVRLACWLGFERLDSHLIDACVFLGNTASRRVLEKNGFTFERTVEALVRGELRREWYLVATRRSFAAAAPDWRPREAELAFRGA